MAGKGANTSAATPTSHDSSTTKQQQQPHATASSSSSELDTMGIRTRAELDAQLRECERILQDFFDGDCDDLDKIDKAELADQKKIRLCALIDSKRFPTVEELERTLATKQNELKACSGDYKKRRELAREVRGIKEAIAMEHSEAKRLEIPNEIRNSSDLLYDAMSDQGEATTTTTPNISMEYVRSVTNGFRADTVIGTGGFGTVYKGLDTRHAKQFVVKKFHSNVLTGLGAAQILQQLKREVEVLSQFRHDNIVRVFGYSNEANTDVCILYEYGSGGSLSDALKTDEGRKCLDWRKRLDVAVSILSALTYLHKKDCSHRDLKPDNICFTEEFERVILVDFGLARLVDHDKFSATCTGLVGWSDPYVARIQRPRRYASWC
uniref:Protein kinase domain-containing protein n=1 Tax=Grammatophora oceanica TaxID=210454 RepID=A0A7S1VB49_9STRA